MNMKKQLALGGALLTAATAACLKLAHDENRCVIVVTHDLSVMDRADVVYRINDGLLERR